MIKFSPDYDEIEDFRFAISNFPHLDSNISTAFVVYFSQLVRCVRLQFVFIFFTRHVVDFSLVLWCLKPLSTIFQSYRGCHFIWREMKPEYPEKTTDLS